MSQFFHKIFWRTGIGSGTVWQTRAKNPRFHNYSFVTWATWHPPNCPPGCAARRSIFLRLNRKTSQLGDANKIIFGIMKTFLNRSGGFVGSADEVQPRTSKKIKAPSLRRGTTTLPKLSTLSLLLAVVSGCQSGKLTHYTSPEVTGRVLAADTHQPLAHADVQRVEPETFAEYWSFGSPKGGTILIEPVGARTDADGRFVLNSKSVVALCSFNRAGRRFQSITAMPATNLSRPTTPAQTSPARLPPVCRWLMWARYCFSRWFNKTCH
jgi:hypothetical protein